jgi:hypothetical protein
MKSVFAMLPLMIVVLCGSPLLAETRKNTAESPDKEKKICRREDVTGSMISKSVCHTSPEWAAILKESRENAETYRNRNSGPRPDLGK